MSETPNPSLLSEISQIYAQLNPQDVEQFYAGYQLWRLQQQITALQDQVNTFQWLLAENMQRMQEVQPSAIALATLAQLQAAGVNDIALLDRMLERGEDWLDRTMQHLEYCEQFDFIQGNYTEWCEYALEGVFDWIGSMISADTASSPSTSTEDTSEGEAAPVLLNESPYLDATEEQLLQKLMSEEDEEIMRAATLKRPAIMLPTPTESPVVTEEPQEEMPHLDASVAGTTTTAVEDVPVLEPIATETAPAPAEEIAEFEKEQKTEEMRSARKRTFWQCLAARIGPQ